MEASPHPWPTLGVLLIRDGLVSKEALVAILDEQHDMRRQRITGRRLGELLVERGLVTSIQIARLVAEQYELPYIELSVTDINPRFAGLLTEDQVRRFGAVPISRRADGTYLLAVADPSTVIFSDELRQILGSPPQFAVVGPDAIADALAYLRSLPAPNVGEDVGAVSETNSVSHDESRASGPPEADADPPFDNARAIAHLWPPLGALLIREGLLSDAELETALAQQRLSTSRRLGEILVERGVVTPAVIARLIAEQYELEYVELDELEIDSTIVHLLSEEIARAYRAVPIARHENGALDVVIADPTNVLYSDDLYTELGAPVTFLVAAPDAIEALLASTYDAAPKHVSAPLDLEPGDTAPVGEPDFSLPGSGVVPWNDEEPEQPLLRFTPAPDVAAAESAPDQPHFSETTVGTTDTVAEASEATVETFALTVEPPEAVTPEATIETFDVTVETAVTTEETSEETVATSDVAVETPVMTEETPEATVEPSEVTVDAPTFSPAPDLDVPPIGAVRDAFSHGATAVHASHKLDELRIRARIDGTLQAIGTFPGAEFGSLAAALEADGAIELITVPTRAGSKLTARPLVQPNAPTSFAELGLSDDDHALLLSMLERPGVVVVSGPRRSGVTSTLYAALGELNTGERIVATIEDRTPPSVNGVDQLTVDEAGVLTLASRLEALCSADCDVLLVDARLESESADMAFQYARGGQHLLVGLDQLDAAAAIAWLTTLGIDTDVLAEVLTCVVAQRLVREVCPACRETYYASPTELDALGQPAEDAHRLLARGRGCDECDGSGLLGRRPILEVVSVNDSIRQLIRAHASAAALRQAATEAGSRMLREQAIRLCLEGVTTATEVARALRTTAQSS